MRGRSTGGGIGMRRGVWGGKQSFHVQVTRHASILNQPRVKVGEVSRGLVED